MTQAMVEIIVPMVVVAALVLLGIWAALGGSRK